MQGLKGFKLSLLTTGVSGRARPMRGQREHRIEGVCVCVCVCACVCVYLF